MLQFSSRPGRRFTVCHIFFLHIRYATRLPDTFIDTCRLSHAIEYFLVWISNFHADYKCRRFSNRVLESQELSMACHSSDEYWLIFLLIILAIIRHWMIEATYWLMVSHIGRIFCFLSPFSAITNNIICLYTYQDYEVEWATNDERLFRTQTASHLDRSFEPMPRYYICVAVIITVFSLRCRFRSTDVDYEMHRFFLFDAIWDIYHLIIDTYIFILRLEPKLFTPSWVLLFIVDAMIKLATHYYGRWGFTPPLRHAVIIFAHFIMMSIFRADWVDVTRFLPSRRLMILPIFQRSRFFIHTPMSCRRAILPAVFLTDNATWQYFDVFIEIWRYSHRYYRHSLSFSFS